MGFPRAESCLDKLRIEDVHGGSYGLGHRTEFQDITSREWVRDTLTSELDALAASNSSFAYYAQKAAPTGVVLLAE